MKNWISLSHNKSSDVVHADHQWHSKSALEEQVEQLLRLLQQQGAVEYDRIAVLSNSSWITVLSLLACSKLGLVFFPVSAKSPEKSRQTLLREAGISLLIHGDSIPLVKRIIPATCEQPSQMKNIAMFIATSGSSGEAKAAMLSHQALTCSATLSNTTLGLESQDCWLNILPLHHIGGISIVIRTALAGAKMILHEGFDADRVWQDILTKQVTHISLVPTMLEKLLKASITPPPSSLKVVLIGGAALNPSTANRALSASWPVWSTYGMSEMASQVATGKLGNEYRESIPLLAGVQATVLSDGKMLSQGSGQLYLKAKTMMAGYTNVDDKPGTGLDENHWLITGDIVTLDGNGNIHIQGRADDILITGGENVHPAEIEKVLLTCPGVTSVCVTGRDDAEWGQKLCATYCGSYDPSRLELWSRSRLNGVFLPRSYIQVDQLPKLANGKIDRNLIRQKHR